MYGVDLRLDAVCEARIVEVWRAIEAAGTRSLASTSHRRHVPHLSLVVAPRDDVNVAMLAGLRPPSGIAFTAVGTFGADGGVVFLAPRPSPELLVFQEQVAAACADVYEHYRPGAWTPHVTLAEGVAEADLGRAMQQAVPYLPLSGTYTALESVSARTGERRRLASY